MSVPVFAVVGHPNKGKSSIVATLAENTGVKTGADPGTTVVAEPIEMRVADEHLYTLVDTPGFQRARRALEWMRDRGPNASERKAIVRAFVQAHRGQELFRDECELLDPIINGAAILYVVDGSQPYGPEYEQEMEILKWTGRPRMALINLISESDHKDAWRDALDQYFDVVQVFDAMTAGFDKRLELLRTFGSLDEGWQEPMQRVVEELEADRRAKIQKTAEQIADMICDMIRHIEKKELSISEDPDTHKSPLLQAYRRTLRKREQNGRRLVEQAWKHKGVEREEEDAVFEEADLFSNQQWLVFGLQRWQIVALGGGLGAGVGGTVEVALAGHGLGIPTLVGTLAGAGGGFKLAIGPLKEVRLLGRGPGRRLRCGPAKSPNLLFVTLGRARRHHLEVARRNHARRDALEVAANADLPDHSKAERKRLYKQFKEIQKGGGSESLGKIVATLLEQDLKRFSG